MKNKHGITILSIVALMLMFGISAQAQTSEEAQKKQQLEQEKQMKEMEMQLKKQQLEQQQKMAEVEKAYAERAREASRARERAFVYTTPSTGFADEGTYFISSFGQENQSQLTIRNSFDGDSDSSEGKFDVDESTRHIKCTINGKANSGKITIKVLYPGGKVFKDLSITSSAQISFTQSLSIKDEEKDKYVGAWTYKVIADKAEGSYSLSFMTH